MSGERKAVITIREDGDTQIEFFPDNQNVTQGLHKFLAWVGFFAIAKANREREEMACEN